MNRHSFLLAATILVFVAFPLAVFGEENESGNSKYYPKMINPPGFYEGVFLISMIGGKTIAPGGSYLKHEKVYDERIRDNIVSGNYQSVVPVNENRYFQAEYIPKGIGQMDLEYGSWEHFGTGISAFQYSIDTIRQDAIPGSSLDNVRYETVPVVRNLFKGNAITMLLTYHPVSRKILDPYLAFRAGFVGFSGEAHSALEYNPYRKSNKVRNGIGKVLGGGVGMNVFMGRTYGIKIEGSYYKNYLKADMFDNRILNSYHAQIGLFMNYSSVAAEMENF